MAELQSTGAPTETTFVIWPLGPKQCGYEVGKRSLIANKIATGATYVTLFILVALTVLQPQFDGRIISPWFLVALAFFVAILGFSINAALALHGRQLAVSEAQTRRHASQNHLARSIVRFARFLLFLSCALFASILAVTAIASPFYNLSVHPSLYVMLIIMIFGSVFLYIFWRQR